MAAITSRKERVDDITDIGNNMTKYIRRLEANVERFKKLPKHEDILKDLKNTIWNKMCRPCRTKLFDMSSDESGSCHHKDCQPQTILQLQPNTTMETQTDPCIQGFISHPLEDREGMENLETKLTIARDIIRKRDNKIKEMEDEMKTNHKHCKNLIIEKQNRLGATEHEKPVGGIEGHTEHDQTDTRSSTKEEMSPLMEDLLQEIKDTHGNIAEVQTDHEWDVIDIPQIQAERQTVHGQISSLKSTNEKLSSTIEALQRDIVRLRAELGEKQGDLDKVKKDNEVNMKDISQLQTDRQTLQDQTDSLNEEMARTAEGLQCDIVRLTAELDGKGFDLENVQKENDEMSSTMKDLQQDIYRLTLELDMSKEEKQRGFAKMEKENEGYVDELSQLRTERQTLQDQTRSLNTTKEEMSSTMEGLQRDIAKLTAELEDGKKSDLEKAEKENEEMSSTMEGLQRDIARLAAELEEKQSGFAKMEKENERNVDELSQLRTERQTLQDQTRSFKSTNEEMSSTMENLQRDNARLTAELGENQGDLEKVQKENEGYVCELSQLRPERQTLQNQICSLKRTNEAMSSNMDGLQRDNARLTVKHDETQYDLNKVHKENEGYVGDISQLQTERQTLQDQIRSLKSTNKEISSTMEGIQRDIARLTAELEEQQGDLNKVQKENKGYMDELLQQQAKKQTLQDQIRSLKRTNEEMSSTMEDLQRDIDRLRAELGNKDEEIHKIENTLEECRRLKRKVVVMRLLRGSRSGLGKAMVDMINKELTRRLDGRLDSRSIDFSIVLTETSTDVSNGPLFVLCLNMSRVGTNILDALEGTKGHRDVYVLVLHHTNKENLSQLTPTSFRVTGSELRQLGGIMDMAFSSDSGLYECDLNNNAIDKIVTVLKRF